MRVRALAKRFGAVHALRDATFELRRGEVLGLLGPNGAGKTTLMATLANLLPADAGKVELFPHNAGIDDSALLYLPDGITPWESQPADWILRFAESLYGRGGSQAERADITRVLRVTELRGHPLKTLSKGQRKRLLLAIVLLAPHPIVLMDEPFDGLDLRQTRETISLFRALAHAGRSLVLSIHSMTDAARVCDRLVLLSDGRTVAEGSVDELRLKAGIESNDLEEIFLALG